MARCPVSATASAARLRFSPSVQRVRRVGTVASAATEAAVADTLAVDGKPEVRWVVKCMCVRACAHACVQTAYADCPCAHLGDGVIDSCRTGTARCLIVCCSYLIVVHVTHVCRHVQG
jgi:hypothetical protein